MIIKRLSFITISILLGNTLGEGEVNPSGLDYSDLNFVQQIVDFIDEGKLLSEVTTVSPPETTQESQFPEPVEINDVQESVQLNLEDGVEESVQLNLEDNVVEETEEPVIKSDLNIGAGVYFDIDKGSISDDCTEEEEKPKKKFWFLPFNYNDTGVNDTMKYEESDEDEEEPQYPLPTSTSITAAPTDFEDYDSYYSDGLKGTEAYQDKDNEYIATSSGSKYILKMIKVVVSVVLLVGKLA